MSTQVNKKNLAFKFLLFLNVQSQSQLQSYIKLAVASLFDKYTVRRNKSFKGTRAYSSQNFLLYALPLLPNTLNNK